ncbi:unnamed protein product, partial [Polarella glacialis]
VMIVAASLVPCLALLFHEAVRDIRRQRQRHGSIQMAMLVLRIGARLIAVAGGSASAGAAPAAAVAWLDRGAVAAWLALEASLFFDVWVTHRGVSCARDGTSQVLWAMAFAGQAALVASGRGEGARPGEGAGCTERGERIVFSGLRGFRRPGLEPSSGPAWGIRRLGVALGGGGCVGSDTVAAVSSGAQDLALIIFVACYICIHTPVFLAWLRRTKQVIHRTLTHIEPHQVVFYDCPHHRDRT